MLSPQVEATYLQAILNTLNEKKKKTTAPLNARPRNAPRLSGQNKRRERPTNTRKNSHRNSVPELRLLLPRGSRGAKRRKGARATNESVKSVKDGRRTRKARRKPGERNAWRRPLQRRPVPPRPRLRVASPMRDVLPLIQA
jgi:hypothetical protein